MRRRPLLRGRAPGRHGAGRNGIRRSRGNGSARMSGHRGARLHRHHGLSRHGLPGHGLPGHRLSLHSHLSLPGHWMSRRGPLRGTRSLGRAGRLCRRRLSRHRGGRCRRGGGPAGRWWPSGQSLLRAWRRSPGRSSLGRAAGRRPSWGHPRQRRPHLVAWGRLRGAGAGWRCRCW